MGREASEMQTWGVPGGGVSALMDASPDMPWGGAADLDPSLLLPLLRWVTSGQPHSFSKSPLPDQKNYGNEVISWGHFHKVTLIFSPSL